jgi:hypothetical protein
MAKNRKMQIVAAFLIVGSGLVWGSAGLASERGPNTNYREVKEFLDKHTQLLELANAQGARLLVAPEYQGRLMTSTCDGPEGRSFGFINYDRIESGAEDKHFNNFGGEDRFWLSPEGGPFALWFAPGVNPQTLPNWYTPPAFNEGTWKVLSPPGDAAIRLQRPMKLSNASKTEFDVEINRTIKMLSDDELRKCFGAAAKKMLAPGVKMVAYESINEMINRGKPMTKAGGLISIWTLGQNNAGPETVILVPYNPGPESALGRIVKTDYFGEIPPERLKVIPAAILFRADAGYRAEIGVSQKRAKNILGSIDFLHQVLTLVQINLPKDPDKQLYLDNAWDLPQKDPYVGDIVNSYNDGPTAPGQKGFGPFYELETLSPCRELASGEGLVHIHRTLHLHADLPTLAAIAKEVLGVDLETVKSAMLK